MSFRRFDPHQSTFSQEPSSPSDETPSPDKSLLSDNMAHPYSVHHTPNPPYSPSFDSNAIPINLPHSADDAHRSQDWGSSFPSPSSHIQLGLDGIRPSTFPGSDMSDPMSRHSTTYTGAAEYHPMSYGSHAPGVWEPTKEKHVPSILAPFSRRLLATFMAASGLLIAGFMGYSLFKTNGQRSQSPPIIEADSAPVKIAPQASTSTDEPNKQDMRIYEKMNANLPRQESSLDHSGDSIIRKEETPLIDPGSQRTFQGFANDVSANGDSQAGLPSPKQVKTVIMRPDGTIISQSIKNEDHSQKLRSSENMGISSRDDENEGGRKIIAPGAEESKEVNATLPQKQKRNVEPPKAVSEKSEDGAPNGGRGFSVQLAATSSQKEALDFFEILKRRYGVLAEKGPTILKVNLAGKMVYRLRVKTASQEESASLCQAIQSQGGSCFVARN